MGFGCMNFADSMESCTQATGSTSLRRGKSGGAFQHLASTHMLIPVYSRLKGALKKL